MCKRPNVADYDRLVPSLQDRRATTTLRRLLLDDYSQDDRSRTANHSEVHFGVIVLRRSGRVRLKPRAKKCALRGRS